MKTQGRSSVHSDAMAVPCLLKESSYSRLAASLPLRTESAQSEDLMNDITRSFRSLYDGTSATKLIVQWQAREFGSFLDFTIRSANTIKGANGTFSTGTNQKYISAEYRLTQTNHLEAIASLEGR